jgi:Uma2 family endonuclease
MTDFVFVPERVHERSDAPISFEEYLRLYDSYEGGQTEWIGGEVAIYPVTNNGRHQSIITTLSSMLEYFVELTKLGIFVPHNVPMRISKKEAPEPDGMVLLIGHEERYVDEQYVQGIPDIVIEVVSPESDARDYGRKRVQYEAAGVPEYWLFDPLRKASFIHVLGEDGRYHLRPLDEDGRVTSSLLPGFVLDPAIFWDKKLPNMSEGSKIVDAMLEEFKKK